MTSSAEIREGWNKAVELLPPESGVHERRGSSDCGRFLEIETSGEAFSGGPNRSCFASSTRCCCERRNWIMEVYVGVGNKYLCSLMRRTYTFICMKQFMFVWLYVHIYQARAVSFGLVKVDAEQLE